MAIERIVRGRPGGQQSGKSTPENYPIATPPGLQAADHSWVLQTTMELQKSVGALTQAVSTDPCLRGLPPDVTVDELEDLIAVEQGKAITLYLRRYDDVVIRESYSHTTLKRQ